MKRYLIWGLGLMWCASSVQAQQMEEILQSVAQNNVELQARQQELEAAGLEIRMQNSLEDPSVEYSPFFRKGESGMTSSELVVKQGFDFPTVYAARGKAGKLQRSACITTGNITQFFHIFRMEIEDKGNRTVQR